MRFGEKHNELTLGVPSPNYAFLTASGHHRAVCLRIDITWKCPFCKMVTGAWKACIILWNPTLHLISRRFQIWVGDPNSVIPTELNRIELTFEFISKFSPKTPKPFLGSVDRITGHFQLRWRDWLSFWSKVVKLTFFQLVIMIFCVHTFSVSPSNCARDFHTSVSLRNYLSHQH